LQLIINKLNAFCNYCKNTKRNLRINQKIKSHLLIFNFNSLINLDSFEPMKTKLFLIITIVMVSNVMFGQISLRPYAGVSISKLRFDEPLEEGSKSKFKPGLNLGVGIDFPINDVFSIETGLGYIQKGGTLLEEIPNDLFTYKFTYKFTIGYLGLPLMLKMQKEIGDVKVSLFGGPSIFYKVNTKLKYKVEYMGEVFEEEETVSDVFSPIDFNLNLGASVEYENFNLGLTWLHGLTGIDEDWEAPWEGQKNTSILINLGYRFDL